MVLQCITPQVLRDGMRVDFGEGEAHASGPAVLIKVLKHYYPTNTEALMLRAVLDFFSFTPVQGESLQSLFQRFDIVLERANKVSELGLSYQFRTWMLLSLLRLHPKRWAEILKECGRRLPKTQEEYNQVKSILDRDSAIESTVRNLQKGSQGGSGTFFSFDGDPQPLYMTLIGGGVPNEGVKPGRDEVDIYEVESDDSGGESEWETDDETWEKEQFQDNWLPGDLQDEARRGRDSTYLAETYWAARKAERKYRAAKGRFGPKRSFRKGGRSSSRPRSFRGRSRTRGPMRRKGKGFFIGETYVSLDHVPDEDVEVFFQKRGRSSGPNRSGGKHPDMMCFRCGEKGHMASDCKSVPKCLNCKTPGHQKKDCKEPARHFLVEDEDPCYFCPPEGLFPHQDCEKKA